MTERIVLLSAGGTGGHLFPAQALAQELKPRGWKIHLATDERAEQYASDFPADEVHIVRSATIKGKDPVALAKTFGTLALGYFASRRLISTTGAHVAVGFGGYPTLPPLLAAAHKGVPTILHEQNAVIGRANKFLASKVSAVATGFALVDYNHETGAPVTVTGNPLRQVAHDAAKKKFSAPKKDDVFNLLVFGGSQGARFFSEVMPDAIELLPVDLQYRLRLTMQARPEDSAMARGRFVGMDVAADVEPFFQDMPHKIADSHLVICRSGASSVSELALIGRPSILVPLPGSLDDDQGANAAMLEEAGGAQLVRQKDLTPEKLASMLRSAMENPKLLAKQAQNAKKAGVPDAAKRLADLVEFHV